MKKIPYSNKFVNTYSSGIDFTAVSNTRKSKINYLFF